MVTNTSLRHAAVKWGINIQFGSYSLLPLVVGGIHWIITAIDDQ